MNVSFHVEGDFHPELPMRVLNLLAQRSLACETAAIVRVGDRYRIGVAVAGLSADQTDILVAKMRALVLVDTATVSS
jgi:hypothetical protein